MTGFTRALRGELYALYHSLGLRISMGLVLLVTLVTVAFDVWRYSKTGDGVGADQIHVNFWPRFAQGARLGLIICELATLVLVGGRLPREISLGAARDPLVRRISRTAFILARAVAALIVPLVLAAVALTASAVSTGLLFDAGHVVDSPVLLTEDPVTQSAFGDWTREHGVSPDDLAAWQRLMDDEGLEPAAAASRLGLPAFELPDPFYEYIPILVFFEEDIRGGIMAGLTHGLLPLMALGLFAMALSAAIATGVISAGLAFGSVLLFGVTLAPQLGERAWWFFADWLPGIGNESQLALARLVAEGYPEAITPEEALRAGTLGSMLEAAVFLVVIVLVFRRRRI